MFVYMNSTLYSYFINKELIQSILFCFNLRKKLSSRIDINLRLFPLLLLLFFYVFPFFFRPLIAGYNTVKLIFMQIKVR